MKTIFDLPAHPLFVHFPVVLVPLTAAVAVAVAVRPGWRQRHGPALAVAVLIAAASAVLASRSGEKLNEALEDRIGDLAEHHQNLGETTVVLTIAFLVGTILVALADRWVARTAAEPATIAGREEWIVRGLMALTAILGIAATIWMVRTGHEGATIVWEGVITDDG